MPDPWEQAAQEFNKGKTPAAPTAASKSAPANEDWKIWAQTSTPEQGSEGPVERFGKNLWEQTNPLAFGNSIVQAVQHPIDTLKGMGESMDQPRQEAMKAWNEGRHGDAFRHAMNYVFNAVPGTGTSLDKAGNQMQSGDIAGGLGTTAGVGTNLVVGAKAPKIMQGIAEAPAKVAGAFKVDPTIAMVRALRPTPSDAGFSERLPQTLSNIKNAAGGPITGAEELIPATKTAIAKHQQALDAYLQDGRTRGVLVPGDSIANATAQMIPSTMKLENPAQARAIVDSAVSVYKGRQFTVGQMRKLLAEKNAELDAFYGRAEGKQAATVTSGAPQAVVKAQRDAIAESLYNSLDPQGQGAGPRLIQKQTGDMINILDAAQKRRNAIMAEKPVSTVEKIKRGASKVASAPLRAVTGNPIRAAGLPFGAATGELEVGAGTADPLIRKAFKAVGEPNAIPRPIPFSGVPQGVNPKLLGPSTATPPPADTSFVRGVSAMPQPPNPARALPAAPTIHVTPPPPDTSGVHGISGVAYPPNPARALPAAPTVRPMPSVSDTSGVIPTPQPPPQSQKVLPSAQGAPRPTGGFAVGDDLVPVMNPSTRQYEYVPKWTLQKPKSEVIEPQIPPAAMALGGVVVPKTAKWQHKAKKFSHKQAKSDPIIPVPR